MGTLKQLIVSLLTSTTGYIRTLVVLTCWVAATGVAEYFWIHIVYQQCAISPVPHQAVPSGQLADWRDFVRMPVFASRSCVN